jgi:hypothetical protein
MTIRDKGLLDRLAFQSLTPAAIWLVCVVVIATPAGAGRVALWTGLVLIAAVPMVWLLARWAAGAREAPRETWVLAAAVGCLASEYSDLHAIHVLVAPLAMTLLLRLFARPARWLLDIGKTTPAPGSTGTRSDG